MELMGIPTGPTADLRDLEGRSDNQDLFILLQEFVADWETMEFFHAARHWICCAPVMSLAQLTAIHILLSGFPGLSSRVDAVSARRVVEAGARHLTDGAGLARHSAEPRTNRRPRFQPGLIEPLASGKLAGDYALPERARNNLPDRIQQTIGVCTPDR